MDELEIVIAEDTKILRELIRRRLSKEEGLRVVGTAEDGFRALSMVRALKPHVLVLDISMPFKDGIQVLEEIRAEDSSTVIIMFTSDQSPLVRKVCLDFGANYFIDKTEIEELVKVCTSHLRAL